MEGRRGVVEGRLHLKEGGAFTWIHPESRRHPEIRAGTDPAQRREKHFQFFLFIFYPKTPIDHLL